MSSFANDVGWKILCRIPGLWDARTACGPMSREEFRLRVEYRTLILVVASRPQRHRPLRQGSSDAMVPMATFAMSAPGK